MGSVHVLGETVGIFVFVLSSEVLYAYGTHLFRPATCLRLCTRAGSWLPCWAELKPFHYCRKLRRITQNSGLTAPVWSLDQQPREPARNADPSPSESARKEGQGSHPALGLGVLRGGCGWRGPMIPPVTAGLSPITSPAGLCRHQPAHGLRSLTVSACPGAGSESRDSEWRDGFSHLNLSLCLKCPFELSYSDTCWVLFLCFWTSLIGQKKAIGTNLLHSPFLQKSILLSSPFQKSGSRPSTAETTGPEPSHCLFL